MTRSAPASRALSLAALAAVVAGAFVLRYGGVRYGLPLLVNGDELPILQNAVRMLDTGDANPGFFHYPSLYLYLEALAFATVYAAGHLAGVFQHLTDLAGDPLPLIGRTLTVLCAAGTVGATWLAGRPLLGPWPALAAAAFVAANPLHVAHSFQIAVDVPAGLFTTLALWAAVRRYVTGPAWQHYVLAAVFAGLATGTKYTAFLAIAPLLWAHFAGAGAGPVRRAVADPRLMGALALVPLVFLLTTPYAVRDFDTFKRDVAFEGQHYSTGHAGAESAGTSYGAYLGRLAERSGTTLPVLALLGGVALLLRSPRAAGLLLAFPVLYFLFIGRYPVYFERNLVPLVPFVALLAAAGVAEPFRLLARGWPIRGRPSPTVALAGVAAVVVSVAAGMSLYAQTARARAEVRRAALPDTRVAAMHWAGAHLAPGSRVLREPHTPSLELLSTGGRPLLAVTTLEWSASRVPLKSLGRFDYVVLSSEMYGRYLTDPKRHPAEAAWYRAVFDGLTLVHEVGPVGGESTGPVIRFYRVRAAPPVRSGP